jgi:hypothetical protein
MLPRAYPNCYQGVEIQSFVAKAKWSNSVCRGDSVSHQRLGLGDPAGAQVGLLKIDRAAGAHLIGLSKDK